MIKCFNCCLLACFYLYKQMFSMYKYYCLIKYCKTILKMIILVHYYLFSFEHLQVLYIHILLFIHTNVGHYPLYDLAVHTGNQTQLVKFKSYIVTQTLMPSCMIFSEFFSILVIQSKRWFQAEMGRCQTSAQGPCKA